MSSSGGLPGDHSSPSKRKAVEEVVDVDGGDRLSLENFLRAELKGHQAAMKGDIHDAMGGVKKEMAERIEVVESEVTKQLQTTLLLLKQLTDKHDIQQEAVSNLTAGQKALEEKFEMSQRSLEERIEKLEAGGGGRGPSAHSTATTEGDGIGGRRAPALVVGGWNDNTPANEVIEKATQVLRQLQVDIDYQDMFVPGIRRGFALIPLHGPRRGKWGGAPSTSPGGDRAGQECQATDGARPPRHGATSLHVPHYLPASGAPDESQAGRQGQTLRSGVGGPTRALGGGVRHGDGVVPRHPRLLGGQPSSRRGGQSGGRVVRLQGAGQGTPHRRRQCEPAMGGAPWSSPVTPNTATWQVSPPRRGENRLFSTACTHLERWRGRGDKDPRRPPNFCSGGWTTFYPCQH